MSPQNNNTKVTPRILVSGGLERMCQNVMDLLPSAYSKKLIVPDQAEFHNTLKTFRPHLIILCIQSGTNEVVGNYFALQENSEYYNLPVMTIGYQEDCVRFREKLSYRNYETFIRPLEKNIFLAKIRQFFSSPENIVELPLSDEDIVDSMIPSRIKDETRDLIKGLLEKTEDELVDQAQKVEDAFIRRIEKENLLRGRKNILVVDDDVRMLNVIKIYLQDLYDVTVVPSGKLALKFLSKRPCDLVLLDYLMPEMDGPEVLRIIREESSRPNIPVVFLTGVSDKELIMKGLEFKPNGYILKPVTKAALLERATEILLGL